MDLSLDEYIKQKVAINGGRIVDAVRNTLLVWRIYK